MAATLQQPLALTGPGALSPLAMAPSPPAAPQALYTMEYEDFDHYCSRFCVQKGACVRAGREGAC
jgi:hypothetical protein